MYKLEDSFYAPAFSVETPHIKWAKPLSGGPLKVLIVAPRFGHRETIELAQRLEMDYRAVMLWGGTQIGPTGYVSWLLVEGARHDDVKKQLADALRPDYDVIILAGFDWTILPDEIAQRILSATRRGTGLLLSYVQNVPADIRACVPRHGYGKGRVVVMQYFRGGADNTVLTPNVPPVDDATYEVYQLELIRAILWAANRKHKLPERVEIPRPTPTEKMPCRDFRYDDFWVVCWMEPTQDRINRTVNRELKRYGVDIAVVRTPSERIVAALQNAGFLLIPYNVFLGQRADAHRLNMPCLNDPAFRATLATDLREHALNCKDIDPVSYDMGSETCNGHIPNDTCVCEHCKVAFLDYLRRVYGSLDALNLEWDTKYKAGTEIEPMTLAVARQRKNLAPWADHRMFMESAFAEAHKFATMILREHDPAATVGLGMPMRPTSWRGYDWWQLSHVLGHFCGGRDCSMSSEQVRSFMPKQTLRTFHWSTGYFSERLDENGARLLPWVNLFHGFNSVFLFKSYAPGSAAPDEQSVLAPDLRPIKVFELTMAEASEIKGDIAQRILNAERENDGIAVHYSPMSLHAQQAFPDGPDWYSSQGQFCGRLEDIGLQYDFISYEQLGVTIPQRLAHRILQYKVLILPYSQAMSDAEIANTREFIREGGLLIADLRPAVMDEHCKTRKTPGFQDIFDSGQPLEMDGGEPRTILAQHGKGHAVLLNRDLECFKNSGGNVTSLLSGLLRGFGVKPEIRIIAKSVEAALNKFSALRSSVEDGAILAHIPCEVARFRTPGIEYVGILPPATLPQTEAVVILNRAAHVYDLRTRLYLGETARVETRMCTGRALLYALCEQEQPDIIGLTIPSAGGAT